MTRTTALHGLHAQLGASFTDFGGWDMPLKYGSELAEHRAVRVSAGIFDLSHMGEVRVTGADAGAFLDYALLAKYSILRIGKAKYGLILDEAGHILDDLITYRLGADEFLVVPNAGNAQAVAEALAARAQEFTGTVVPGAAVTVSDESEATSLVAVQGPQSEAILLAALAAAGGDGAEGASPQTGSGSAEAGSAGSGDGQAEAVRALGYYAWTRLELPVGTADAAASDASDASDTTSGTVPVLLARTGYTGEDGFELYVANADAAPVWHALTAAAESAGIALLPCGLAARDSLRMEAGMPLYGNEMDRTSVPADIGLGRMAANALKKEHVFARAALEAQAAEEPARVLVGLTSEGRRAARAGSAVQADGQEVGIVTSGQPSPTLGRPIALARVDRALAEPGTPVVVDIRGKAHEFAVAALPFYSRG
ncbi:glycine cleavage T C-terminal barrel domain-containing protein [Brevibacterium album]|uniref:glycine cleavage T C-terminal barrel domain-containing protein n=1 Tax=Brevibacterium album TaxID=417948 RepID=UPI0004239DE1|nr:glycine cleavage T C-terminal barrel domain-containing protein [Brevibacterium album]